MCFSKQHFVTKALANGHNRANDHGRDCIEKSDWGDDSVVQDGLGRRNGWRIVYKEPSGLKRYNRYRATGNPAVEYRFEPGRRIESGLTTSAILRPEEQKRWYLMGLFSARPKRIGVSTTLEASDGFMRFSKRQPFGTNYDESLQTLLLSRFGF
jgi:hypothetical protein